MKFREFLGSCAVVLLFTFVTILLIIVGKQ